MSASPKVTRRSFSSGASARALAAVVLLDEPLGVRLLASGAAVLGGVTLALLTKSKRG